MLTYNFENLERPIYAHLYESIKNDILGGKLAPGEKLPSKRTFAKNNGISTITIQTAYDQLISEGYIYTLPKKGYYVASLEGISRGTTQANIHLDIQLPKTKQYPYDLSNNGMNSENFPFTIWSKLSREVMNQQKEALMTVSPAAGIPELREAIAQHLQSFRGMLVDPNQIIIGAGTEYLYRLIVQLLGSENIYGVENPGYKKLAQIYGHLGVDCRHLDMDDMGVTLNSLVVSSINVAHICPNHHFPTGITMPASRRYEILSWANGDGGRYIIEDDYDSEFRLSKKPIPTLFSIDGCGKVIYMNTFSKSLSPTIRISYMVLPVELANAFYQNMSFLACTVSNFEQYTLAKFISQGYFEKHINRMRLYYLRQRTKTIAAIRDTLEESDYELLENDAGLHFLLRLHTNRSDGDIVKKLHKLGVQIRPLSEYYQAPVTDRAHWFIVNYSNLNEETVVRALELVKQVL